jgi:hypothetical protein
MEMDSANGSTLLDAYKEIKGLAKPMLQLGRLSVGAVRKPAASKEDPNPEEVESEAMALLGEIGWSKGENGKMHKQ